MKAEGRAWRVQRAFRTGAAVIFFACFITLSPAAPAASRADQCGGSIEKRVWKLWDAAGSEFLRSTMMIERLQTQGDTYALYDIQGYAQNLAVMAARCRRRARLAEIASIVGIAYTRLEPAPGDAPGRAWICHGGRVCNERNHLKGSEVRLNSLQFLAFALHLANAIAALGPRSDGSEQFVSQTVSIAIEQMERWTREVDKSGDDVRLKSTPHDVVDGQSKLFFTDADLWTLTLYSDLAELIRLRPDLATAGLDDSLRGRIKDHWSAIARLLRARLTLERMDSPIIGRVTIADLDRGFWRLYADSRYAGYTQPEAPVSCAHDDGGPKGRSIPPDGVPIVQDIGWDFSHARRFVHAFDALTENRLAVAGVFAVDVNDLPPPDLPSAFAANLVTKVWNNDLNRPLFANYWSGANGWYRVSYDNGTVACFAGYGPSELSDSFITGGFAIWSRYFPIIGRLARRIYALAESHSTEDQAFIVRYYPGLAPSASPNNRMLTQLMFWPTLILQ